MKSPAFVAAVASNSLMQCNHAACSAPRSGLNAWCSRHLLQARRLGHPDAKPLRSKTWAKERAEVAQLLQKNGDHPGVLQVLDFIGTWMAQASQNERSFKGADEVARLVRHGVTAAQVLAEVGAFYLWSQSHPHALPTDRAFDFAMSRAVYGLAPRPRRPCGTRGKSGTWRLPTTGQKSYSPKARTSGLAHVGQFLRKTLAPLLVTMAQGIDVQRQREVDPAAALKVAFKVHDRTAMSPSMGLPF